MAILSLKKGEKLQLKDKDGQALKFLSLGLSWGSAKRKYFFNLLSFTENVDLDASMAIFDKDKCLFDQIYYGKLVSSDQAFRHYGDDLIGEAQNNVNQDNEVISIDFEKISNQIHSAVLFLTSFRNQDFEKIPYAQVNFYEGTTTKKETLFAQSRYNSSEKGKNMYSIILLKLLREGDFWTVEILTETVIPQRIPTCMKIIQDNFL